MKQKHKLLNSAIIALALMMALCWTGCQSDPEPEPKPKPEPVEIYKGHNRERLRGCMVMHPKTADMAVLGGEWKANHVRWPFVTYLPLMTIPKYMEWIESECAKLDALLPEFRKHNMLVCLDLHDPPGQRRDVPGGTGEDHNNALFYEKRYQDAFIEVWEYLAERYKDEPVIWSYDLANEPGVGNMPNEEGLLNWYDLAFKTIKAIRKIDPEKAIVVEACCDTWFDKPYDKEEAPNVIYSAHMYAPLEVTHQTIVDWAPNPQIYPGFTNWEGTWNKDRLLKHLQPTITWAKKHKAHIYIGEFSCVRWAPGSSACNYVRDCIEIFEALGWDWSYHAFREAWDEQGFSPEHDTNRNNRQKPVEPTDRELLLKEWFVKNK